MLTPLDIQKKEFRRSFRGYNEEEVDKFLDQLVQNYEALYLENQSLKEKLENGEAAMARYLEMEKVIKNAVIMAQKNADDLERNARQEAELLLEDARLRAEKIIGDAEGKAARTLQEARERARYRIEEAENRVRDVMEEYRLLNKQVQMFRVKFRSFLEAQISLLDDQEEEVLEMMSNFGSGWLEAAAGRNGDDAGGREDTDSAAGAARGNLRAGEGDPGEQGDDGDR
ncbi:DivIVA domain-containing protein [Desulfallas thermosapovorans]|uniref:Cell division initiation protein n=1 Tax=Desulfallas thermosapovorans DSM 6562 TaxID=1121431 RepID=A0A5S4ZUI0_9FIRM|nr:DivIVA domain-containing protein [Desulfallas thermosapovorans]TYO95875.1 cell division initiation protein [Desulfallas thermosapovorans DSM 6562]